MKKWTHTGAFKHFGTKPKNVRWSWSARSTDGKSVVATFWQDRFEKRGGRLVYDRLAAPLDVSSRPGFSELMENLAWARDRCDGRLNVIIAIAKDTNAEPRSIRECFPSGMVMRLRSLDTNSGAFVAEAEAN
jgi:hypothetical protein